MHLEKAYAQKQMVTYLANLQNVEQAAHKMMDPPDQSKF